VKPAVFEDEGPQLNSDAGGQQQLKSVVVDRPEELDFTRSAQLPPSGDESPETGLSDAQSTNQQTDLNSQLEEDLRLPFGVPTEPQPEGQQPEPGSLNNQTIEQPGTGQTLPFDAQQQPDGAQQLEPLPGEFLPGIPPGDAAAQPLPDDIPIASPEKIEEERQKAEEACADSLANLRTKTIETVNLSIAVSGTEGEDFPFECMLNENDWHSGRAWPQTTFLWKASALCHKPLYFEDEQLERYGHSFAPCCQPLISGAHFFTRLPVLPYCMGVEPPTECVYALGHYRPGSCAPYMCDPIPISYRGALFQAGAVVGAAAVLP
jgi:hypothetical protein